MTTPATFTTIDILAYLANLNGDLTPSKLLEHYRVLKLSLLRARQEDAALFDIALREVTRKLKIKEKTIKEDLARLADPPASKEARELLDKMGQSRVLRLAQDFQENKLWFGVISAENKLLLSSDRKILR